MKQKYIYKIKEIFLTKQGEGYHTGRPSVFLRFSGCNLWSGLEKDRVQAICNWCDTDFVGINGVNGGNYDIKEILDIISNLWPSDSNSEPFLVCTGGEPLLQLDQNFVDEIHKIGFKISIETNGTKLPPNEIDWICVSPKKDTTTTLKTGNELKFVYPQKNFEPTQFENYGFKHFFIQPMDNSDYEKNKKLSETFVEENPKWKLSLQTHKILGFP
jgi:7-carboxy-7-deazaguanine synthase